jgi:hypothetical protein
MIACDFVLGCGDVCVLGRFMCRFLLYDLSLPSEDEKSNDQKPSPCSVWSYQQRIGCRALVVEKDDTGTSIYVISVRRISTDFEDCFSGSPFRLVFIVNRII